MPERVELINTDFVPKLRAPLTTPDLLDVRAAVRRARDSARLELRQIRRGIPLWDSGMDSARATK